MAFLVSVCKTVFLVSATNIASITILELLARADGIPATAPANWGWSFELFFAVSAIPAAMIGIAATKLRGSYARRLVKLSALALAFYLVGATGLGLLLLFAPGDDPYALPLAPHFWEILTVSVCAPALAGVAVLAHWLVPGERLPSIV